MISRLDDDWLVQAKIRDESRSIELTRLEKRMGDVYPGLDFESAIGQPFEKHLELQGYEDCRVFSMDVLYGVDGRHKAEIDYMVSGVKNGIRSFFCMEVKSVFHDRYFDDFAKSLRALKELIAEAFDDAQCDPKKCPKFRPQQTELRAYFGEKAAVERIQPVVGAPYICEASKAEAREYEYWCWMKTDQGFVLLI